MIMIANKRLILASKSPRRYELLLPYFEQILVDAPCVEEAYSSTAPEDIVKELALCKLADLPSKYQGDIIVTGDTIVWFNGKVYGKPKDADEAAAMLRSLSGNTHQVFSGYCVAYGGRTRCGADKCDVQFKQLTEKQIEDYVLSGSPMDKAGAYGVQDGVVVQSVTGDIDTVIGLPVAQVIKTCKELIAE